MKKCLWILGLSLVLAITWGGEVFAQKEMTFSGTNYWGFTPKALRLDPDRVVQQSEISGVRVNDSGDGPFHGASTYIMSVAYRTKGYFGFRGYEAWTDKDGDKMIWELLDTPPGASRSPARLIEGTGKYIGWKGTMEYTLQFPKSPGGTVHGICREYIKIVAPQ